MQRNLLGKTGLNVSVLGFGGAPASFLRTEAQQQAAVVNGLLDAGVNLIDTATMYAGHEEFIGEHLAHRRGDFVLVSKVGGKHKDVEGAPFSDQNITNAIDRALRLMKTDVMLLHSCDLATLEADDALASLVRARDAGKIRFAGYSGDGEAAAFACRLPDVAVLECSLSFADQRNIDEVLPLAKAHNVGVIAKRPIANACWKDLPSQPGFYKNYAKTYTDRLAKMGLTPADVGMTDAQWPELALRFTIGIEGVATAIVGTTDPDHVKANLGFAEKGPLPAEAIATIRQKFDAAADESWTGQT